MLISGANAPCDLRLLFPAISSAAGGWVTASSWRRQQASRNGTAATGGACTGVLADAFGFYLQQIASSSMNELRAAQQERLRNSTCSVTGEPVDRAGADPSQLTQLDVSHFAGMFIVLLVAGLEHSMTFHDLLELPSTDLPRPSTHVHRAARGGPRTCHDLP